MGLDALPSGRAALTRPVSSPTLVKKSGCSVDLEVIFEVSA